MLLEGAAASSGRSLVQEVEHRLESSFKDENSIKTVGGENALLIVRPILYFLGMADKHSRNWKSDPAVADAMSQGVSIIVHAIFTGKSLSKTRQTAFLIRHHGAAAEIAFVALAVLQALGLAEKFSTESQSDDRDPSGGRSKG